jgi:hypothetical protein
MFNIKIYIERWKYNSEYELYVSTDGGIKDSKKKLIKPVINPSGYFAIIVPKHKKFIPVHRIVAETFLGIKPSDLYNIDHINHNRHDNRLKNLRYITVEQNWEHEKTSTISKSTIVAPSVIKWCELAKIKGINMPNNVSNESLHNRILKAAKNNGKFLGFQFQYQNGCIIGTPIN